MTSTDDQAPPFISRVRVQGFRSLAECDVRLGPLTVLAGFNASGKSNFLDAIRFVRDALAYSPAHAIAERGGLESVLRRVGTAGESGGKEIADSFLIALELALRPDGGRATYEVCIGRDPTDEFTHLVLRESCSLRLPGEDASFSTDLSSKRKRDVKGGIPGARLHPKELLLPVVGRLAPYDELLRALLAMRFYELETDVLRGLDDTRLRRTQLGERGEHLGQVLGLLAAQHPSFKESLDGFMRWLIPSLLGVDQRLQGDYATIQARFWTGDPVLPFWNAVNSNAVHSGDPYVEVFQSEQLSEGTVRGTGVLAALFQPDALTGAIPLVAIEEPEIAIHPARVAGLFDAIKETSIRTQVIVTTQSSDLLDTEEVHPSLLRIVEMVDGVTRIGELSDHTQRNLLKTPSHLADMHRQGHLRPAASVDGGQGPQQ
ncbi:AAA family ATPase [Sphaerisporangium sp. NPDC049002]|uniref:AAA family ATPase n=1 Tax=Sphaerisporangium sp. NPDC049002 TaxID=3155392 RepID=UPI0033E45CB3